jgi:D-arginine dehydrogenase
MKTRGTPVMIETCDVMVIGAGIAGASLAATLAAGRKVVLLEREVRPGMHSTGRSAAMFHLTYGGPKVQPLNAAALLLFKQLDPGFWPHPVLSPRGMIMIADAVGEDTLAQHVAESSGALTPISVAQAQARFPLLRKNVVRAAAIDETGQDIDVDGLHQGYLRQLAARGSELVCHAGVDEVRRIVGNWVVTIGNRRIEAPMIVNAAGAWGDKLAEAASVRGLGLAPKLRTAALIDAPAGSEDWPMLIDSQETFYVKPDAGRLILSPADETDVAPHDAAADDFALAEGADRMAHFIEWEVRRKPVTWAGLRTFSPDRVPVIGFDPEHSGFFWLVGQGGFGVQSVPAVAALAAYLIDREEFPLPGGIIPELYAPARFRDAS